MKASYEFACYKNAAIHFLRYELSRVDYCDQLFGLLFWWHPFTAEDPLVNKWCYAKC